jgi:hypothetical protein
MVVVLVKTEIYRIMLTHLIKYCHVDISFLQVEYISITGYGCW